MPAGAPAVPDDDDHRAWEEHFVRWQRRLTIVGLCTPIILLPVWSILTNSIGEGAILLAIALQLGATVYLREEVAGRIANRLTKRGRDESEKRN